MLIPNQKVKVKWNGANKKHYESCGYTFAKNGEEFEIDIEHLTKGSNSEVEFICDWCEERFHRVYKTAIKVKGENHFCCHECSVKYNSKTKLEARPWKTCEWCNKSYQVLNYEVEISRFCCRECMTSWQSEAFKGEGSSKFVERIIVNCDWCKSEIERTPNYLSTRTYNFCDRECQKNWHREVFVKSDDFIANARQVMINNLTTGKISFTESKPQVIINELLTKNGIKFLNEKPFGEFSFDNYLYEHDLLIEVNGGFWHCDNRFYDEINYDMQLNRIISDKRKRTYIKNKHKKNILYLWEFDIETNLELCNKLINKFIENKGKLKNYQSFNYYIDLTGEIQIYSEIISPYMDWNADKLASIVNLEVRERVSGYQPSKHITFNCEYCNKEKTQNITQYIRSKNHFCSVLCKNLSQQIGNNTDQLQFIHECSNCNDKIEVQNYVHQKLKNGEQKHIYCSNECKAEWQSKNLVGENNPQYSRLKRICEYEECKKEYEVSKYQKDRTHYCSVECRQKGQRNRIIVKCLNCDKDVEKTPTDIKKNKSGEFFCSHGCHIEYKKKSNLEIRKCEYCNEDFEVKKKSSQRFCCIICRNKGITNKKK